MKPAKFNRARFRARRPRLVQLRARKSYERLVDRVLDVALPAFYRETCASIEYAQFLQRLAYSQVAPS